MAYCADFLYWCVVLVLYVDDVLHQCVVLVFFSRHCVLMHFGNVLCQHIVWMYSASNYVGVLYQHMVSSVNILCRCVVSIYCVGVIISCWCCIKTCGCVLSSHYVGVFYHHIV